MKTCELAFGSFNGIKIFAEEINSGWWEAKSIHVNPRKILFRHNGNGLSVEEALKAFTYLREEVSCILHNPEDAIHILPGVDPRSHAFWSLLEIPIDLHDPEGKFGREFRDAHFPKMSEGARYKNGNFQIGPRGGPLKISFYRKDKELNKLLKKYEVEEVPQVFRIEVTLSQGKLLEHLGKEQNVEKIDERDRLVRFTPEDLIECHRRIMTRLQGCYAVLESGSRRKNKLPRYMALIAHRGGIPLADQFSWYESEICCGDRTKGRYRAAAREALAEMSPLRLEEVFSDAAYRQQPRIEIRKLERFLNNRREQGLIDPGIRKVYGED